MSIRTRLMNALCGTLLLWQRLWRWLRDVRLVVVFAVLGVVSTVAVTWAMAWWLTSDPRRLDLSQRGEVACASVVVHIDPDKDPYSFARRRMDREKTVRAEVEFGWPWRTMGMSLRTKAESRAEGFIYLGLESKYVAACDFLFDASDRTIDDKVRPRVCLPLRIRTTGFVAMATAHALIWAGLWLCACRLVRVCRERWLGRRSAAVVGVMYRILVYAAAGLVMGVCVSWLFAIRAAFTNSWEVSWTRWSRTVRLESLSTQAIMCLLREMGSRPGREVQEQSSWRTGHLSVDYAPVGQGQPGSSAHQSSWDRDAFGFPFPAMSFEHGTQSTWSYASYSDHSGIFCEAGEGYTGGLLLTGFGRYGERGYSGSLFVELIFPLTPDVVYTALNTIFWGGGLWLIVWGSRRLVDRHMARVGVCRDCGYDVRGLVRCPECGKALAVPLAASLTPTESGAMQRAGGQS
ncbi:MAG: hypothetical protein IBJ18_12775 [Phycisphaerales bacterium]|nr:hypothetical protein [Phycisphaerales bacterium]